MTVADIIIDYESLHDAANQLNALETEISTLDHTDTLNGNIPSTSGDVDPSTLGPGNIGWALSDLYSAWNDPLDNAGKQIRKLSATFTGIANAWFDVDASQSAAVNASMDIAAVNNYGADVVQYNKAEAAYNKALTDYDNAKAYDEQNDPSALKYLGPPPTPPTPPTDPGAAYSSQPGASSTVTYGPPDPKNPDDPTGKTVASETTTVTVDGMTYTETTAFGPDKGWANGQPTQDTTQTITHSDGSTDKITITENTDGSATETDVSSTGTTTTATRAGWTAQWVDTTPPNGDNSNNDGTVPFLST